MIFESPQKTEVMHVLHNLQESSLLEMMAGRKGMTVEEAAEDVYEVTRSSGMTWVAYGSDGTPVSLFGYTINDDGTGGVHGYASKAWRAVWRPVTRTIKNSCLPHMWGEGVKEAYSCAADGFPDNHRWLEFLGAKPATGITLSGKSFTVFAWLKEGRDVQELV